MDYVPLYAKKHRILKIFRTFFRRLLGKCRLDFAETINVFVQKYSIDSTKTLLLWEMGGYDYILIKNAILGILLKLRGYKPLCIICDGIPQVCIQRGLELHEDINKCVKNEEKCRKCLRRCQKKAEKYGIEYRKASEFIDHNKLNEFLEISQKIPLKEIRFYKYLDVKIGDYAFASFNRYMKGYATTVEEIKPEFIGIYRKYLYAGLINTYVANKVVENINPSLIITSHATYTDYAPIVDIGVQKGINTTSWSSGYEKFMHYFASHKSGKKAQLREVSSNVFDKIASLPFQKKQEQKLKNYFYNRYTDGKSIDIPHMKKRNDSYKIKNELGIHNTNKTICLFAHVNWDACLGLSKMIFETANEWVTESIKKMMEIENINWIIRTHPGEKFDGSLFTTYDLIEQNFDVKKLPDHIKVLSYDSGINSYDIYKVIDGGITIFGTVGVELPYNGKPVIVAGKAHYSDKGFTYDVKSKEEYFALLQNASEMQPLRQDQIEIAKKYAYLYFIRKQIPFYFMNKEQGHWGDLDLQYLDEFLPGHSPVIDTICDAIIKGREIILNEDALDFLKNKR
ncbi:MAG: hypothetical protein LBB25_00905 [Holosporaceae bacterium]|jgi:hypothetical protein|nr:hypothetical protein [Holosporaceae bacterium]